MRTPTRLGRARTENGHAWNLRKECRFCGMKREFFDENGKPECQGSKLKKPPQQAAGWHRDRGQSCDCAPPTPPDIRVRIWRFGGLSGRQVRDGS